MKLQKQSQMIRSKLSYAFSSLTSNNSSSTNSNHIEPTNEVTQLVQKRFIESSKRVRERKYSMIQELSQELKAMSYLSSISNTPDSSNEHIQTFLQSPAYISVSKQTAHALHESNEEFESILFGIIDTQLKKKSIDSLLETIRLTRNPLFQTEKIINEITLQIEELFKDPSKVFDFIRCLKIDPSYIQYFLSKETPLDLSENYQATSTQTKQIEYSSFEFEDDLNISTSTEQTQRMNINNNRTITSPLESSQNETILNSFDTPQQKTSISSTILYDKNGASHVIQHPFLRLLEITYTSTIEENFSEINLCLSDKEYGFFALWMIIKNSRNEDQNQNSTTLLSSLNTYLKSSTQKQPQIIIEQALSSLSITQICEVLQATYSFHADFSTACIESLLTQIKQTPIIVSETTQVIRTLSVMLGKSNKKLSPQFEELIKDFFIEQKVLQLPAQQIHGCFFSVLRVCTSINSIMESSDIVDSQTVIDTLFEVGFSLYGSCIIFEEKSSESPTVNSIDGPAPLETFLKFLRVITRTTNTISSRYQLSSESNVLLRSIIETLLHSNKLLESNNHLSIYYMDILVNTNLIFDKQTCNNLNSFLLASFITNNETRNAAVVSSYLRFAARHQFIKSLDNQTIENCFASLSKTDNRLHQQIYESILFSYSKWITEEQNKQETLDRMWEITYYLLKSVPMSKQNSAFPISFCVSLRNFLTQNAILLKTIKDYDIVSLEDYWKSRQSKSQNEGNESKMKIPFLLHLISNISPENQNLKSFLENRVSSENNDRQHPDKIFRQIEAQISGKDIIDIHPIFIEIRSSTLARKHFQNSPKEFNLLKKYVGILLSDVPSTNPQIGHNSEEVVGTQVYDSEEQSSHRNTPSATKILFLARVILEKDPDCIPPESFNKFISHRINEMDLQGVLFSKQFLNTRKIQDSASHRQIEKQLSQVLSVDDLTLMNALTILKAFSLNIFDAKTLFSLEREIVKGLSIINHTNLAVLCKKYYYRSSTPPTAFLSGLVAHLNLFSGQLNDKTIWVFLLISKFKPSVLSSFDFKQLSLSPRHLSSENLQLFLETITEANLPRSIASLPRNNNQAATILKPKISALSKELKLPSSLQIFQTPPFFEKRNAYQVLIYSYFFEIAIPQDQIPSLTNALLASYEKKEISLYRLTAALEIIYLTAKKVPSIQTLQHLINEIRNENQYQPLEATPCLRSNLRILQMLTTSYSTHPDYERILESALLNFTQYKIKRFENPEDIIACIRMFSSTIFAQDTSSNQRNLKERDLNLLNRIEQVFLRRMDTMSTMEVLEIFNAYYETELASFQIFESCDNFLADIENRTFQRNIRVNSTIRASQRQSIGHQNSSTKEDYLPPI